MRNPGHLARLVSRPLRGCPDRSRVDSGVSTFGGIDLPRSSLDQAVDTLGFAGQIGIMRRDEERDAPLGLQLEKQIVDDGARLGVEVAGGLVGEDDLRPVHESARHGHALLLATRELAGPVTQPIGQADLGQRGGGALARLRHGDTLEQRRHHGVLERGRSPSRL